MIGDAFMKASFVPGRLVVNKEKARPVCAVTLMERQANIIRVVAMLRYAQVN